MHRAIPLAALVLLATSCVAPRSIGFGQTAMPMPAGGVEVAGSPGFFFRSQNGPPIPAGAGSSNVAMERTFGGSGEGNVLIGLTDRVGLNVHVSPAGLQPGAKISFSVASLTIALLPEFALAYWSTGASNQHTQGASMTETDRGGESVFEVLLGAKLIASHSSGLYGGIGYDYQRLGTALTGPGTANQGRVDFAHALELALGWEFGTGAVKIRPELALMILPSVGGWTTLGTGSRWAGSGSEFVLFPNVTIALQTSHPAKAGTDEGMKQEELSVPPVFSAP